MNLREAIEHYVGWRQAHGAKFNTARNLLRQVLRHADGEDGCDAVTQAQVASFLAGPVTPHRENKVYARLCCTNRLSVRVPLSPDGLIPWLQ